VSAILYVKEGCPWCEAAESELHKLGVKYERREVRSNAAYFNEMKEISGQSKAQTVGPLGNKYFMDTGNSCTATDGSTQDRYVFVNNIPSGRIPFISSAMGTDMTQFEGLVPGVLEDLAAMDPATTACRTVKRSLRLRNEVVSPMQYAILALARINAMPERVSGEGITAEICDGLLTVTLPFAAKPAPKRISVN
jgi:glutaredoxin